MLILLMALKSMHILHSPPFFGASTTCIAHRLKLSLINPSLSNNYWNCRFISSFYVDFILCSTLFGKFDLGIKSMWCDILLVITNILTMPSTNMSHNFFNNSLTSVRTPSIECSTLRPFGMIAKKYPYFSSSIKNSLVEHVSTLFSQ